MALPKDVESRYTLTGMGAGLHVLNCQECGGPLDGELSADPGGSAVASCLRCGATWRLRVEARTPKDR